MASIGVRTLHGGEVRLDASAVERLVTTLRGNVLVAGSPDYDVARSSWNGMIDLS